MKEFPKWKYHAEYAAETVEDKEEEEALGEGWFDTPAEATQGAEAPAYTEEERLELLAKAKSMGLKPAKQASAESLAASIAAKESEHDDMV